MVFITSAILFGNANAAHGEATAGHPLPNRELPQQPGTGDIWYIHPGWIEAFRGGGWNFGVEGKSSYELS